MKNTSMILTALFLFIKALSWSQAEIELSNQDKEGIDKLSKEVVKALKTKKLEKLLECMPGEEEYKYLLEKSEDMPADYDSYKESVTPMLENAINYLFEIAKVAPEKLAWEKTEYLGPCEENGIKQLRVKIRISVGEKKTGIDGVVFQIKSDWKLMFLVEVYNVE